MNKTDTYYHQANVVNVAYSSRTVVPTAVVNARLVQPFEIASECDPEQEKFIPNADVIGGTEHPRIGHFHRPPKTGPTDIELAGFQESTTLNETIRQGNYDGDRYVWEDHAATTSSNISGAIQHDRLNAKIDYSNLDDVDRLGTTSNAVHAEHQSILAAELAKEYREKNTPPAVVPPKPKGYQGAEYTSMYESTGGYKSEEYTSIYD